MPALDDLHGRSPSPSRRWRRARWRGLAAAALAVGLAAAVIAFGASKVDGSTTVADLEVGDCLDEPYVARVDRVDIIDCSRPHELEVFALIERTDPREASYPGDEKLLRWAAEACEAEFKGYVGVDYAESDLFLSHFTPQADGWEKGDRGVVCIVYAVDENLSTATVSGSVRAPQV